jgi:hypothetical protein
VSTSTDGFAAGSHPPDPVLPAASPPPPDWTGANDRDPGITTLAMFGWATHPLAPWADDARDPAMLRPAVAGMATGLEVSAAEDGRGLQVTVAPGLAVGADGSAIEPDALRAMCFTPWNRPDVLPRPIH